jgi:hypothetical protein
VGNEVVAVALTVDAAFDVAVPFEVEVPTLEGDAVPLPDSRPPHATAPSAITASHARRMLRG